MWWSQSGCKWQYGCTVDVGLVRLHSCKHIAHTRSLSLSHTHNLLLFHCNNGFVNEPQCDIVRTLPFLVYFIKMQLMLWITYFLLFLIAISKWYHSFLSPFHFDISALDERMMRNENRRQEWIVVYVTRWHNTMHIHTYSSHNHNISFMWQANTDIPLNKPIMWQHNQHLICYTVISPIHTVTLCGNVTSVYMS